MAMPTLHDVHIDAALSNVSIAYRNGNYIADQVFPNLPVSKKSDKYFVFAREAWYRNEVTERAPGDEAEESDYGITTASYNCSVRALAKTVSDEVRFNADSAIRPELEAVEYLTDKMLLDREVRVAALTTGGSGLWIYSSTPGTAWTSDLSDPLGDIDTMINGIVSTIGQFPNTMVMSWAVWKSLRNHPDLLERIKYTRTDAIIRPDDLAQWTGIPKILVGTALVETAREGATSSPAFVWGDQVWCGYVPAGPSLMTPAAGYTFLWEGRRVRRYRLDTRHSDKFEVEEASVPVICASDAGGVLYNAV